MYKIEIKSSSENLQRISIFLENNHIKHNVIKCQDLVPVLDEIDEIINWPF